ncbi:MAG: hypothetical protein Q8906_15215, partial [Bacillota bacterium]|nr:hypothetical protein [Bacillota bacterium]
MAVCRNFFCTLAKQKTEQLCSVWQEECFFVEIGRLSSVFLFYQQIDESCLFAYTDESDFKGNGETMDFQINYLSFYV